MAKQVHFSEVISRATQGSLLTNESVSMVEDSMAKTHKHTYIEGGLEERPTMELLEGTRATKRRERYEWEESDGRAVAVPDVHNVPLMSSRRAS